jgi:hypothetical protein
MLIDFTQSIKNIEGKDFDDGKLTLAVVSCNGLLAPDESRAMQGTVMVERWLLAKRIFEAKEAIEISPEEASTLREAIRKAYPSPAVVGPAWTMLQG